ncbi:competence type IV pilus major pilin ComGC [Senegalia massiliensis]|jgi:type IV pilus assembly protein PilA|uniref:competence type IV pilus major pilin ComGC n=1 Tax=Senegalia massiliensis TaxID=1720316 RepID=UPI0010313B51|nr:prepilin-type N-terminal cleavage/methylation domain-containing protein [Senegalia massiliensis]
MLKWISKKIKKDNKGFTLVELIVVLAILGIIAVIAVPRFIGVQDGAKKTADEATEKNIGKAVELALAEEKISVPESGSTNISMTDLVDWGYLDEKPTVQSEDNKAFKATVDSNGKITITTEAASTGNNE